MVHGDGIARPPARHPSSAIVQCVTINSGDRQTDKRAGQEILLCSIPESRCEESFLTF